MNEIAETLEALRTQAMNEKLKGDFELAQELFEVVEIAENYFARFGYTND